MENAITFSINRYDKDGDIFENGIYLHFGDVSIKIANDIAEFKVFYNEIEDIIKEIEENY